MNYKNIYDMHTHSDQSFDGAYSCFELCESAIEKGLNGIAITDHLDIDDAKLDVPDFVKKQFNETSKAKYEYNNRVEVIRGIELGQGIYRKKLSDKVLNETDYDFVLGAIHNLENVEDFYFLNYNEYDVDDLLTRYFCDVLKLAEWNKIDSIAHLTYPLRYICGNYKMTVDINKYAELIDAILETVIKNNKAIEINTSSIDCYHFDTMPNKAMIKRFKELGGKYVTVGSDAHKTKRIGFGIETGLDLLLEAGFENYTIFKNREAILIPIERN